MENENLLLDMTNAINNEISNEKELTEQILNYFVRLRERIEKRIVESEKCMLMKCEKIANWKSELKEAYNKMADKEALKECFEE